MRGAILLEYRQVGDRVWPKFNALRDDTLWYYRAVLDVFRRRFSGPLVEELSRKLDEVDELMTSEPCRDNPGE
jgi:hypothetical protein